jgi:hypothetical protein
VYDQGREGSIQEDAKAWCVLAMPTQQGQGV